MNDLSQVAYNDGDVALTGLLALPEGQPRAAVLVYPTIMNPTESVLNKARELAKAGYLAFVADFYGKRPENFDQSMEFAAEIRSTPSYYRQRVRAALKALVGINQAQGLPMAAIGFCMGGQAVLELAREGAPMEAVVSFHGLLNTEQPAEKGAISARILICHGDQDPLVPRSQVLSFWEEMDQAGANWHFHSYSGVKHGFTNPGTPNNPAVGYDASADRQSWAAMHSLFEEIFDQA